MFSRLALSLVSFFDSIFCFCFVVSAKYKRGKYRGGSSSDPVT